MQQQDGSCFSVIEYESYEKNYLTKNLKMPEFRRGWAIWNFNGYCWNGFILQLKDSEYEATRAHFEKYLQAKQTPFIF